MGRKKGITPFISEDNASGMEVMTIKKTNRPDVKKLFSVCLKHIEEMESRRYSPRYSSTNNLSSLYERQRRLLNMYQGVNEVQDLFGGISRKKKNKVIKGSNKRGVRGGKKKKGSMSTLQRLLSDNGYDDIHNTSSHGGTVYLDGSIFSRDSLEAYRDDECCSDKLIYYYDDILDESSKTVFYDVFDFDEYCKEQGIDISDYDVRQLLSNSVSHCCINPYTKNIDGQQLLMVDASYGGLRWLCCENDNDLFDSEDVIDYQGSETIHNIF